MQCDCKDWQENIKILDGWAMMSKIHGGGGYTGKCFKFCPWCGKRLEEEEINIMDNDLLIDWKKGEKE